MNADAATTGAPPRIRLVTIQPVTVPPAISSDQEQEPEWDAKRVADEFAAIMTAAGFGDRVVASTLSAVPPSARPLRAGEGRSRSPWSTPAPRTVDSRVRSPPPR